ncbi:hypothetical protein DSECCO2_257730 [anaerobic digester metagenome]
MNRKNIKNALSKGPVPKRLLETQHLCKIILNEQQVTQEEERTGFWIFLSDIFRHSGLRLWGMQILILIVVCAGILSVHNVPNAIPLFTPLFLLASIPSLFQNQTYNMCEIEAATRASGAQIVLAKLVLAGAADLICLSITLVLAAIKTDFSANMFQLILYAVVPFLGCMVAMLWCIRTCKRHAFQISMIVCFSTSMFAGGLSRLAPKLYQLSAIGLWIIAFVVFTCFFVREIYFLTEARKEGKMYGSIA